MNFEMCEAASDKTLVFSSSHVDCKYERLNSADASCREHMVNDSSDKRPYCFYFTLGFRIHIPQRANLSCKVR